MEGFKVYTLVDGELWNTRRESNYRDMGFDFVDTGGHRGKFNAPWEAQT